MNSASQYHLKDVLAYAGIGIKIQDWLRKRLTPRQQEAKEAVLVAYEAEQQAKIDDINQLEEEEIARLEDSIKGLSLTAALSRLGLPGPSYSQKDVARVLFPGNGFATALKRKMPNYLLLIRWR